MVNTKGVKLIVHPGMPKCASSSIQAALITNLDYLQERSFFVVDRDFKVSIEKSKRKQPYGIPYGVIHDFVDGRLNLEEETSGLVNSILDFNLKDDARLVISSELLSFIATEKGKRFHSKLVSMFENKMAVIVVRSPWSQILSNWRQGVYRTGEGFHDYVKSRISANSQSVGYFQSRIDLFKRFYGEVEVLFIESPGNVVSSFFETIGCPGVEFARSVKNRSLSPVFCDAMSRHSSLFEFELDDIRNTLPRHKNILADMLDAGSSVFSDRMTARQFSAMEELFDFFKDQYVDLIVENDSNGLNRSYWLNKFEEDLELRYGKELVEESHLLDEQLCMFAEVVSSLRKLI